VSSHSSSVLAVALTTSGRGSQTGRISRLQPYRYNRFPCTMLPVSRFRSEPFAAGASRSGSGVERWRDLHHIGRFSRAALIRRPRYGPAILFRLAREHHHERQPFVSKTDSITLRATAC
jgi:hypothetical protein